MKSVSLEEFNWIKEAILLEERKDAFVEQVVPKRFSHYCKIFHPMFRDNNIKDETILWPDTYPNEPFTFDVGEKISYKQFCAKYNLPFSKEVSTQSILRKMNLPRYIIAPTEGEIEEDLMKEIVKTIKTFSINQQIFYFFNFMKIKGFWSGRKIDDLLYQGELNEVFDFYQHETVYLTPTYFWPEDKSWCICNDHDLDFTLVGGSKDFITSLLSNNELEAFEVFPNTRIDYKADEENN
ncbi:hypothetical protein [Bacillus sp. FJAT-45066]|uniref:hypothetical protein n=1 Tax=Bacillus sp. FJAT-45066 TaxID=2011010 RepID=UPI000BB95D97|nr:hypothetical protein [Bacillus sp. FJAT-45066]